MKLEYRTILCYFICKKKTSDVARTSVQDTLKVSRQIIWPWYLLQDIIIHASRSSWWSEKRKMEAYIWLSQVMHLNGAHSNWTLIVNMFNILQVGFMRWEHLNRDYIRYNQFIHLTLWKPKYVCTLIHNSSWGFC